MKKSSKLFYSCGLLISIFVCNQEISAKNIEINIAEISQNITVEGDTGSFVYTGYEPLADRPVLVHYYNPGKSDARVLILMHGNGRGAISYFKSMLPYAKKSNILLIVPEFTEKLYPSRDYHLGGVMDKSGNLRPEKEWTFSIIEPLFDEMKARTGNKSEGYMFYGYSAGSQFVHRYLTFVSNNRVIKAIPSAAGYYTMPDYNQNYPYGLAKTKVPKTNLVKFFAKPVMIVVGDADTVLSREDLPKNKYANEQGRDRVERGLSYFNRAKALAKEWNVPFNWSYKLVPHVGHSQGPMAKPIAELLFETEK